MRPIRYVSGQQLLTRTLQVILVLVMLEDIAFGIPTFFRRRHLSRVSREQDPFERDYLNHLARIIKRSSAMSNTKSTYTMFYDRLVKFTNEVPSKLKSDAPEALRTTIGSVTKIIKPTSYPFQVHDVEKVVKGVMLTCQVTEKYLKTLDECNFVKDSERDWFSGEKGSLDMFIVMNKMALANLRMENDDIQVIDSAMGGVNLGVDSGIPMDVVRDLQALLSAHNSC